jgi:hypothetical protein
VRVFLLSVSARADVDQRPLLPRRINWLADQEGRICALARAEFLRAAVANFGDVEIAFLIDAHSVRVEEASGPIGQRAPRVHQMSSEVVLDNL